MAAKRKKNAADRYGATKGALDDLQQWLLDQYVSLGQATVLAAQGKEDTANEIFDQADSVLRVVNYALSDGFDALSKRLIPGPGRR